MLCLALAHLCQPTSPLCHKPHPFPIPPVLLSFGADLAQLRPTHHCATLSATRQSPSLAAPMPLVLAIAAQTGPEHAVPQRLRPERSPIAFTGLPALKSPQTQRNRSPRLRAAS